MGLFSPFLGLYALFDVITEPTIRILDDESKWPVVQAESIQAILCFIHVAKVQLGL